MLVKEKAEVKELPLDVQIPPSFYAVRICSIYWTRNKQQEVSNKKGPELSSCVKLPKIELVSFIGDKTKRIEFWDSF